MKSAIHLRKQRELLKPHDYQNRVIRWAIQRNYGAILLDPGLGKTIIALIIIRLKIFSGKSKGALVVTPLRPAYMTWPAEIEKWDKFAGLTYTILHSEHGKKEVELRGGYHIYIINPEGIPWLAKQRKLPFDLLIVDESTKFRSSLDRKNVRGKDMRKIAAKMRYRFLMTGTPVANSYQWIQGQWAILDLGRRFGLIKKHFLNSFFRPVGKTEWRQYEFMEETLPRFERMVAKDSIRIAAKGNIRTPKIKYNPIYLKMKNRKYYDDMHKKMLIEVKRDPIIALSASSAWQKCWQIANGAIYKQDVDQLQPGMAKTSGDFYNLHDQKLDAIEDLLEELNGKPLLTAYNFKHDKERLKKRFGKDLVILEGSMDKINKIQNKWNAGEIHHLAAYPGTSALGLNLQKPGNNICFFSMITDNEAFIQFIQRVARQGCPFPEVYVHMLLMKGTVDTLNLYPNLKKKEGNQQTLLKLIAK